MKSPLKQYMAINETIRMYNELKNYIGDSFSCDCFTSIYFNDYPLCKVIKKGNYKDCRKCVWGLFTNKSCKENCSDISSESENYIKYLVNFKKKLLKYILFNFKF